MPGDTEFPILATGERDVDSFRPDDIRHPSHTRCHGTAFMKHGPYAMSGMSANGSARIDVTDAASLLRWSLRFRMTESRLVEVVARVGTMANAVECYVRSRGYKP